MSLKSFLMKLLPFLYSLADRVWSQTPKEQQVQALKAVAFTQAIKDSLTAAPDVVMLKIVAVAGISMDAVRLALTAIGETNKLDDTSPEEVIKWAQYKATYGLNDIGWNQHWDNIAKALAVVLSDGKIDWLSLMLGLLQVALDVFNKGK